MKTSTITLALAIMLSLTWSITASAMPPFADKHKKAAAVKSAKDFVNLFSKHDGRPGHTIENWYAENTSQNQVIKITVLYTKGNPAFGNQWTKTFTLEPGQIIGIGTKRLGATEAVSARIKGARFI